MFFHQFVASDRWISTFKYKCNICSEKVKKDNVDNCRQSFFTSTICVFSQFVIDVRALLVKYNEDFLLNTDQSGLELQIHSNRTVPHQDEKSTRSVVRSLNQTTDKYTVQPMISLNGKIVGPIFLCLKVSEKMKAHLYKANNVLQACRASDKLTTSLLE